MAGLFFQPEGLFKVTFDIFGIRDSRRKQARGWTAIKTLLLLQIYLDFIETYVCSLIYKLSFSADYVSHLHFAPWPGSNGYE